MNKLEQILSELMKLEYDINAFCVVLKALKAYCEAKNDEELKMLIYIVERQVQVLGKQLADDITKLDEYLLEIK